MPARQLPPEGSLEFEQLLEEWRECHTGEEGDALARKWGFKAGASLNRILFNKGYKKSAITRPEGLTGVEAQVLKMLKDEPLSVGEISRRIDRSKETVIKIIDSLRAQHYHVQLDEVSREVAIPHEPVPSFEPTEFAYFKKFIRIGLVADTHICSKRQQMTLLHDAYSIMDSRECQFILHAGDLVDGIDMWRGHRQELFKQTAEEQREYTVDNYPKSKRGIKTYVIGGQHDHSFYKQNGYDIVEHICEKRKDLVYKGFYKADFNIRGIWVNLQHPGGGVSYARSYRVQKIIEGMVGFIVATIAAPFPSLAVFGHWHVPLHLPNYMGVDAVSLPCFQAQTIYLQQKGLMPSVGFAIADIWLDKIGNTASSKIEFIDLSSQIKQKDY